MTTTQNNQTASQISQQAYQILNNNLNQSNMQNAAQNHAYQNSQAAQNQANWRLATYQAKTLDNQTKERDLLKTHLGLQELHAKLHEAQEQYKVFLELLL